MRRDGFTAKPIITLSLCAALHVPLALSLAKGVDAGPEMLARVGRARETAVLERVADYYLLEMNLTNSGESEESAELREIIARDGERLGRDGIDYRSFKGVRGQCGTIHGDWFFDGTWAHNNLYMTLLRLLDLPRTLRRLAGRPARAADFLPGGGVPDSAFFINREIEAITPAALIARDRELRPQGEITVSRKKQEGRSEGFFGRDERGLEYIFIVDPPGMEEQVTGAEVIGATLVRMAGYWVPTSTIVTVSGTGDPDFDGRRAVATKLIDGYRGHWSYSAFRNRREIRATRIFAAWVHNTDWVDHNTGISVVAYRDIVPLTRYYIFDFGSSLGSWNVRPKRPRDGWENDVDFGKILAWPLTRPVELLGLLKTPYSGDGAPFSEAVGYFDSNVRPDRYESNYPNAAWRDLTRDDGLWAARLISRYSEDQLRTVVDLARFSRREDADYLYRVLLARRKKILDYYGINLRTQ